LNCPFVKVEATTYTEVGYKGKDVDTIIEDLVQNAFVVGRRSRLESQGASRESLEPQLMELLVGAHATAAAYARVLELLRGGKLEEALVPPPGAAGARFRRGMRLGGGQGFTFRQPPSSSSSSSSNPNSSSTSGLPGDLKTIIETHLFPSGKDDGVSGPRLMIGAPIVVSPPLPPHLTLTATLTPSTTTTTTTPPAASAKVTVAQAREMMREASRQAALDQADEQVTPEEAIRLAESSGIVFIDEIDKIATNAAKRTSSDVAGFGVQRDLLPLIEGTRVTTKFGPVDTSKVLFICGGAFYASKPTDLLPELQGRLPIRVNLNPLTEADLYAILTHGRFNLLEQQKALLATEGVSLTFDDQAVREIARLAHVINSTRDNTGARQLHTLVERVVHDISFEAPSKGGPFHITQEYVRAKVEHLLKQDDLKRFLF
jgi:ATP-dependent HslUV protease ATP-binding subunit HslU